MFLHVFRHIIHDIEKDLRSFVNGDALMIEFSKCIGVADHIIKRYGSHMTWYIHVLAPERSSLTVPIV